MMFPGFCEDIPSDGLDEKNGSTSAENNDNDIHDVTSATNGFFRIDVGEDNWFDVKYLQKNGSKKELLFGQRSSSECIWIVEEHNGYSISPSNPVVNYGKFSESFCPNAVHFPI